MKIIVPLVQFQQQLRVFHWQTESYAQHKALGKAYEALDGLIDSFVEVGILEINGNPDYRMQKQNEYTKRWNDIYLFDNGLQCTTAMEDLDYARWLDPDRVPCYVRDDDE